MQVNYCFKEQNPYNPTNNIYAKYDYEKEAYFHHIGTYASPINEMYPVTIFKISSCNGIVASKKVWKTKKEIKKIMREIPRKYLKFSATNDHSLLDAPSYSELSVMRSKLI